MLDKITFLIKKNVILADELREITSLDLFLLRIY